MFFIDQFEQIVDFFFYYGYWFVILEGNIWCFVFDMDVIDVCDVIGFYEGILGMGIFDYVVFCVFDFEVVQEMQWEFVCWLLINVYDRKYFCLFYVCDLVGILIEYVIDVFGFFVDEDFVCLGEWFYVLEIDVECVKDLCVMLL